MTLTGVGGVFCASHDDPLGGPSHGHSYEVIAWFKADNRPDARCFQAALNEVLKVWDHGHLPAELCWAEDIAEAVGKMAGCVEVEVRRPLERLYAKWAA